MEQQIASDESTVTEEDLRDAGASASYIAYYQAAQRLDEETASTRHAEKVVAGIVEYSGGGFHESLWNNERRFPSNEENPYGADLTNGRILAEAGVHPYDE
jgi:hypothetical protein